ncbi:MAG TPA: hypothetical protein VGM07_20705 [Stellaceae bacterium]
MAGATPTRHNLKPSLPPNRQYSLTLQNACGLVRSGTVAVPGKWLHKFKQSR